VVYARLTAAEVQGLRIAVENHPHIRTFCRSGKEYSWEMVPKSPTTEQDVEGAPAGAIAALDASFFPGSETLCRKRALNLVCALVHLCPEQAIMICA
jgi:hypothetical protein